jgi:hypothetical protein
MNPAKEKMSSVYSLISARRSPTKADFMATPYVQVFVQGV